MCKKSITKVILIVLAAASNCLAGCNAESLAYCPPEKTDANEVEAVLKQLSRKTKELKSYQCSFEYKFEQPLFESQTSRKGELFYQKLDDRSILRVNFRTLKHDDEQQQKYAEDYLFDGVWLTKIDYQTKQANRYQQAEPNKPVDAFDLASQDFPIVGFSKIPKLKEQFEIKFIKDNQGKENDLIQLHLKVKPESVYKDDYTSIDFWIYKKLYLPGKIVSLTTEGDIHRIDLLKARVNRAVDMDVFRLKIPKDFSLHVIPLEKENK
ncbi:MAG: hypothetical protein JXB29_05820 [Sedimentisphaerales bacterium]|nr:hypothetical protein [Sedimentisphaerales bacterium]